MRLLLVLFGRNSHERTKGLGEVSKAVKSDRQRRLRHIMARSVEKRGSPVNPIGLKIFDPGKAQGFLEQDF